MNTIVEVAVDIVVLVFCLAIGAGIGHRQDRACKQHEDGHAHAAQRK